MKVGLVIYTQSVTELAKFYSNVFGLDVVEREGSYAQLSKEHFELVLLETEESKSYPRGSIPRESTPIKPTFFISEPLELIAQKVKEYSGLLYPPKDWTFGGNVVCDGYDPEGNIFQLRVYANA